MSKRPRFERKIGGAGTGKTQAVLSAMTRAREELGLEPEQIGFSTFTRNGRAVMARRAAEEWDCSEERLTKYGNFRTTHSMALRSVGVSKDQLLTKSKESIEWVAQCLGTDFGANHDDEDTGETISLVPRSSDSADAAFSINAWNLCRNRLVPFEQVLDEANQRGDRVPSVGTAKQIVEHYEMAKRSDERLDFTDLLGQFSGYRFDVEGLSRASPKGDLPAEVRMLCLDEAQDASALIDAACQRLANAPNIERCLIVGDPFQALFAFGGGSAEHFMSWDVSATSVMPQSFRCPAPIMNLGEACLQAMHQGYWDRGIAPALHEGVIEQAGNEVDAVASFVEPSVSTLILARCAFTLERYAKELTQRGIPFSRLGKADATSHKGFRALWSLSNSKVVLNEDLAVAVSMLEVAGLLQNGAKAAWLRGDYAWCDIVRPDDLEQLGFRESLTESIKHGDWIQAVSPRFQRLAEKWVSAARQFGPELASEPQVRLSTIHSAKGAEADTVILSTESSSRVTQNSELFPAQHDEECRVSYVAVTRARARLVVVEDAGRNRLNMPYDY